MRRVRSTANLCVGAAVYRKCVKEWLFDANYQQPPLSCWPEADKGSLRSHAFYDTKSVTSGYLTYRRRVHFRCDQATKLEQSVLAELSTNEVLAGSAELDSLAHDFTCHMQAIFSLLRAMRAEDLSAGGPRKYPETGGFRRRLASADWNVLHPILKQIEVAIGYTTGGACRSCRSFRCVGDRQRRHPDCLLQSTLKQRFASPQLALGIRSREFAIRGAHTREREVRRARAKHRHRHSPTTWTTTTVTICRLWRIALLLLHPTHESGKPRRRLSSCHRRRLQNVTMDVFKMSAWRWRGHLVQRGQN